MSYDVTHTFDLVGVRSGKSHDEERSSVVGDLKTEARGQDDVGAGQLDVEALSGQRERQVDVETVDLYGGSIW